MNKIDSTSVFEALLRGEDYKHLHQEIVVKPSIEIVKRFLEETTHAFENTKYSNGKHTTNGFETWEQKLRFLFSKKYFHEFLY
jgi:hypothetical protein